MILTDLILAKYVHRQLTINTQIVNGAEWRINQIITASSDTSACRAEWEPEQIPGSNGTCHVLLGALLQPKDGSCCCGGSGSYDAQRPVLSAPVALAAVGAAAGGVLAADSPTILVTILHPVVANLRHTVLRIRGGPVAAPESSRTLNTATRIGLHIPYFLILLYSPTVGSLPRTAG